MIELLGIETSATHMEWFYGPKGLKFSEIGARPPGVGQWDLYCAANDIGVIAYSPMQAGLLTGKFTQERVARLPNGDWRGRNSMFQEPQLSINLALVERLRPIAERNGIFASHYARTVGLEDLLVCRIADDEARVVENTCSHADLPLGDQQLDGRCVTCPAHGAKFDIDSGATLGPPAPVGIAAYAARIRASFLPGPGGIEAVIYADSGRPGLSLPDMRPLTALAATANLTDEQSLVYFDLIYMAAGESVRRQLEDLMQKGTWEYQSPFARKYIAEGRAVGDTTTLADPAVVKALKERYEEGDT